MKLIAFSGKKQSGKSVAASVAISKFSPFAQTIPIAGELKRIISVCFDSETGANYDTEDEKNRILPCERTVREVLQIVGTDMLRKIDLNCWTRAHGKQCVDYWNYNPSGMVVVPDIRFPNELKHIHGLGGVVIRLLRSPHNDKHVSETALDHLDKWALDRWNSGRDVRYPSDIEYGNLLRFPPTRIQLRDLVDMFDCVLDNRGLELHEMTEIVWKLIGSNWWRKDLKCTS